MLAVLAAALCFIDGGPLRWIGGFALTLAIPGDAIRRLLRVADEAVPAAIFTFAMSLSVAVLVGVAVDQFRPGISARTMAVGLLAVSLIADAANLARADPEPTPKAEPVPEQETSTTAGNSTTLTWKHYTACAVLFALPAAFGVALSVRAQNRHDTADATTALSIVRQGDNAVVEVVEGASGQHSYRLRVRAAGAELLDQTVTLDADHATSVPLSIASVAPRVRVEAALSRLGANTPFRVVWLVSGSS